MIAGFVLLVLSGVYWMGSNMIAQSSMSGSVGADGLPKLLAIVLAVLSVILIIQSIVMRRLTVASQDPVLAEEDGGEPEFTRRGHILAAVLLVITIVYSLLLPYAGYAVSIGFLLLAVALFYGRRPSLGLFAFVSIGAFCFHSIFVSLLGVRMPVGIWPGLFQ
jgi:preprotein translocase subunit SecG